MPKKKETIKKEEINKKTTKPKQTKKAAKPKKNASSENIKDKKTKDVKKQPKEKKPKVDYKKKFEELEKQLILRENKIISLEIEKKNLEFQFKESSKGFATKAKDEIANLKKQLSSKSEKDLAESIKYAPQKFIDAIFDPLINLEIAVNSGESQGPEVQAYVMGFKMLLGQMFDTFSRFGIQLIVPKPGDNYDPVVHDVFGKETGAKDKIISLKKKGMKLHDRVIKPAMVVIGK